MPKVVLEKNPDEVFQGASKTPTIAVVGDIRRSQDLMTYAQKPRDFSKRMVRFITKTRKLIDKHAGFFDKFTGDGFIVYFNHAICKAAGLNYIECFTNFLSDEFDLATPLFQEWSLSIRKLPTTEIGLAIGADIGQIKFEDIDNHLIAVGDAIVWAARMASVATSNETIVNNLLFAALKDRQDISFQERSGQTKTGETFLAKALNFADASQPSDA
jgi:class 3 adenylate cyclase